MKEVTDNDPNLQKRSSRIPDWLRNFDSDIVMVVGMLIISIYMFLEAGSFSESSQNFPQMAAGATAVGSALLLLRNVLPERIHDLLFPTGESTVGLGGIEPDEGESTPSDESVDIREGRWYAIHGSLFTGVLTTIYVVVGVLFGFVWITPLFVAGYLYWFEHSWITIGSLAVLSWIMAYLFVTVFGVPLETGILLFSGGI